MSPNYALQLDEAVWKDLEDLLGIVFLLFSQLIHLEEIVHKKLRLNLLYVNHGDILFVYLSG